MSGEYVAYSIRPNKSIERLLFVELLQRIDRALPEPVHEYCYVGMGGPFLEDFKLMYSVFGMQKMISIEESAETYKRQEFNKPYGHIQCLNMSSGRFIDRIDDHIGGVPLVVWLDYTAPSTMRQQIIEFETLLPKLSPYDIVKITLNALPNGLSDDDEENASLKTAQERAEALRKRLGDKLPNELDGQSMAEVLPKFATRKRFPRLLSAMVKIAAYGALEGKSVEFQPLSSYVYADGQQMFTFTGILLPQSKRKAFVEGSTLSHWDLASTEWDRAPMQIRVPFMSLKERNELDSRLAELGGQELLERMGYLLMKDEQETAVALEDYRRFSRHYSHFVRALP